MSQPGMPPQGQPGLVAKHLPILSRVLRSAQERNVVFGCLLLVLGAGMQLISWTSVATDGEKLGLALGSGLLTFVPALLLIRTGLRRVPPLLRRLDEQPRELGAIQLDYLVSNGMTLSRLQFVFRDRRRWQVVLPADVGKAMYRDFAAAYPWVSTGEMS